MRATALRAWIFRFVSILSERYTHGRVFDFYKKTGRRSDAVGRAEQRPSAQVVSLRSGLCRRDLARYEPCADNVNSFNLGTDEYFEVNDSIGWITGHLGHSPKFEYFGGDRAWIGGKPFIFLDTARIRSHGWRPKLTIREGIVRTLSWLSENRLVVEQRG